METIIRLNHRNKTQLKDIVNYINTIIGARVIDTYNSKTQASAMPQSPNNNFTTHFDLSKKKSMFLKINGLYMKKRFKKN